MYLIRCIFSIIGMFAALVAPTVCYAASNPSTMAAPSVVPQSVPYPTINFITPQMYGAKCDGSTDDRTAFFNANAAAVSTGSLLLVEKTSSECVIGSNLTLSASYLGISGGALKPSSGSVTVTFTGANLSGAYLVCDTSASGICDLSASPSKTLFEWLGVAVGNSAAANTTAMNNLMAHGSTYLEALTPGKYNLTCVPVSGKLNHIIEGLGTSVTPGATDIVNGIYFAAGCLFPNASEIPGDICASHNVGFYPVARDTSVASGNRLLFSNITVGAAANVIPVGVCWSTSTNTSLFFDFDATSSTFLGYCGWLWEVANGNTMIDPAFYGTGQGAECYSLPNVSPASTIQKISHIGGRWSLATQANTGGVSPAIIWQSNPGSFGPTAFSSINYFNGSFENGYNGFTLCGYNSFYDVHMEAIANTVSTECSVGRSYWNQPYAQGGNTLLQLAAGLQCGSNINSMPAIYLSACTFSGLLQAAGNPNGVAGGGTGSFYGNTSATANTGSSLFVNEGGTISSWVPFTNQTYSINHTTSGTVTLTRGSTAQKVFFDTTLTNDLTITLAGTNAVVGDWFKVIAPASLGGHTFTVSGSSIIANQYIEFSWDGSAWRESGGGTLP